MGELTAPLLLNVAEEARGSQEAGDQQANGELREQRAHAVEARSPWLLTTVLLLGDMFGLGALTLPADFARLGYPITLCALTACTLGMCYSGVLFARLATVFPQMNVFDQIGEAAYGRTGQRLVYVTIYACILITPVIFQITCAESLQTMLPGKLSTLVVHALILLIMIPLAQVKNLEEVGWLSLGGTLCMVAAVAIAFIKILLLPPGGASMPAGDTPAAGSGSSVRLGLVAFMDIVFAYGGAANWMRYISGMKHRRHFNRVASVGAGFMTMCYLALGVGGYAKLGTDFDLTRPITSVLPYDQWTVAMNAALFMHCIVAYAININVWIDLALHLVARCTCSRSKLQPHSQSQGGSHGRVAWAVASCVGLAFCFLVAFTLPYFSLVVALISSLGDLAAAYALPALFTLQLSRSGAIILPAWERWVCIALVPLAFGLSGVGMYSSLHELIAKVLHLE